MEQGGWISMEKSSPKKVSKIRKRVHFGPNEVRVFENTPEMILERKRYWEIQALDRWFFDNRRKQVEEILAPILDADHRMDVYKRLYLGYETIKCKCMVNGFSLLTFYAGKQMDLMKNDKIMQWE
jgi:hypothetical protein